jgi:hypothetical protein
MTHKQCRIIQKSKQIIGEIALICNDLRTAISSKTRISKIHILPSKLTHLPSKPK